ncbi:MAG: allophanate hydrolase [Acidimicrobiia bacterium]|nr:allophanate hydrolase [Acidimicrobiia bacterium]
MTIAELLEAYRTGRLGVVEVIASVLEGLAGADAGVLIGPPLWARAEASAKRLAEVDPASSPLYGVPYVAKGNMDVLDAETTAGCPAFAYHPERDATVIARLEAAGAVCVGIANLDQFATGLVGTRSPYGIPTNAFDSELVPGGSSSGSAIAVARGLVPFSLGTDTAGSGRVPAALGNVVGLKPTVGRVSTDGIVAAVRRADCVSVFALMVGDAAAVLNVIEGADGHPFTARPPAALPRVPSRPRVGVLDESGLALLDPEERASYAAAVEQLRSWAASVVAIDPAPLMELGALMYSSALVAERTSVVGDFLAEHPDSVNPVVAGIIGTGRRYAASEAFAAEYELIRRRADVNQMWETVDVLALPTVPGVPRLEAVAADPLGPNARLGTFTAFVNLIGAAAVVVPSVRTPTGRPTGLQLVARAWSDDTLVVLADSIHRQCRNATLGATGRALAGGAMAASSVGTVDLAVVGAHRVGQPLNGQLTSLGGELLMVKHTSATYRLYALANTSPPKPGLVHATDGAPIEVEVWRLPTAAFGSFVDAVPAPMCIGTVELDDGSSVKGFLCEPRALAGAEDITQFGSWLPYITSR